MKKLELKFDELLKNVLKKRDNGSEKLFFGVNIICNNQNEEEIGRASCRERV